MNCISIDLVFTPFRNLFKMGKIDLKWEKLLFLVFLLGFLNPVFCQEIPLKNKINNYIESINNDYDVKKLNLRPRDIGSIFETEYEYTDFFQIRSFDKKENALQQKRKLKIYINVFSYESEYVLENALRYWFDNFVGGEQIRPGRTLRGYDNARPMYVIIDGTDVLIADIDCKSYNEDIWKDFTKSLRNHFDEHKRAIIIEVFCNGPLEWRQNAPNFRKK